MRVARAGRARVSANHCKCEKGRLTFSGVMANLLAGGDACRRLVPGVLGEEGSAGGKRVAMKTVIRRPAVSVAEIGSDFLVIW